MTVEREGRRRCWSSSRAGSRTTTRRNSKPSPHVHPLSVKLLGLTCMVAQAGGELTRVAARPISLVAPIVGTLGTLEPSRLQTAPLETASENRTGRDRCGRGARAALCRLAPRDRHGQLAPRSGNPRRRLLVSSKAVEFVEFRPGLLRHTASQWARPESSEEGLPRQSNVDFTAVE